MVQRMTSVNGLSDLADIMGKDIDEAKLTTIAQQALKS
jgi:hypothetical protein